MRLSSWLSGVRSHLFRSTRQTRKLSVSRRGAVASMVQVLESRVLLSAVNWTGAGWDLQWNTAANWDTNATPGATDDVTIGVVGASAIQIAGNSADVHSLLSNSPIEIVDTSLRLEAGGGFIGGLNVAVGGSLVVAGGTATCESSGTIAGTMTIGAGAALVLMGSQNLTSTSTLSGAGEVDFDTGYHTVAGTYAITASTTVRENGIADFLSSDKTVSVGNSLVIESGGLANFHDHPLSVPYLEILGGELDQDGPIDVTSQFVWLTGTLRGSGTVLVEDNPETVPNFILSNEPGLQDNIWTLDQKTVKNEGTGVISLEDLVTSAEVQFENHGHLVNDGTLTVLSDSTPCTVSFRSVDSSFSEFTNWGVLTIDAGAESGLESYISLFNGGLIGVQTGMFSSVAGGVVTGSIEVEGGATLELDGEFSLNEESEVSGAGDVYLQLGYATGTNNIVIYGTYDVSGITYCKEGTVIVTSSGDFTVEGLFLSECTFYNYGLMTIGVGDENPCQVSNTFFNLGTLELRSGQFEISTSDYILAGVTQLIGGSILVDSDPLHLNGGGLLSGSGLVTGAFVNDGIVGPGFSPGVITVTGNYSQTRGGQLTIELEGTTPGTEYDQLVVGGDVALAGTLYVSGFNSSEGQSFTIIRNDGTNPVSGTFAGLGEGDCLVVGTRLLQISYQGGDGNDVTLTDRLYIVSNTADGGTGSLRQAILDADASPGSHTISFHIPGGGTHMISPQSALPVITNSVTLDGTTQPGYAGSPVIEIDGGSAGAGNVAGLSVGASGTVIRGLDIGNFSGPGLEINGDLLGSPLTGVTVEQNWLGLNPFGTGAQANQTGLSATNVTGLHIANNVISGNTTSGVVLTRADQSVIVGNRIGTTVSGTAGLANGETGIVLGDQVLHSVIGGSTPALRNTIALNGVNGVSITGASVGNTIRGNAIYGNGTVHGPGLGIDLAADGVTPNDTTDADNGPNELQNFPVLSLVVAGASTRVIGTIQGAANTLLTIDFYVAADSTGLGEGQVYIGSTTVTTDAAGLGAIDATLAYATTVGSSITATATDTAGNTSEFSAAVGAVVEPPIVDTSVATTFNRLEGNSTGAIVLATFTNGDPNALAGTLGASVVWGGAVTGTPTVSVVLAQRTATASYWQVVGNAVFTEPGNYHVKVTVSRNGVTKFQSTTTTVAVAEAPLTNTTPVNTLFAVKGVSTSTVTLATFTDGNPLAPAADFKYTVNWGGALSGAATTSLKLVSRSTTSSTWSIVGSANYLSRGVYTVGVTVNDVDGASFSTNNTKISVANGKITDISVATTYTTVEGNSTGLQTLATFTDSNPNAQYADFDGISSAFTGALVNEGVFLELVSRTATLSTWRLVGSAVYVMPGVFTVGVITSEINGPKVPFAKAKFKVVDADLTDTSISQLLDATEGVDTGDVVLATFSDANPLAKVTDFTLSVTWGKLATPTSADASIQLVSRSATSSNWKVVGHAAYANKGLAGPTVKISDVLGESLVSAKTKFSVQDAPLTDVTTPATVDVIEGSSTGIVTLATFSDANPYAPLTDFKATVSWGGTVVGTPSVKVALVERGPTSSTWVVTGSVVYRTAGLYTPRVGIKDVDGSFLSSGQTTLKVADAPLTDTTVTKILTATEAKSTGQITLATFTDGNPQALAADFDVSVNWGGAVTITPLVSVVLVSRTTTSSNWAVKGSTIFRDAGVHTIAVHVAETSGSTLDTDHVSVNVADAPLTDTTTSRTVSALHGVSTADLTLARFTDATPTSRSTDFSVSVDWGGTTTSSDFQLVQEGSSFSSVFWKIVGHVTYATAGTYTVTVTINDVDGATLVSKRTKFKVT